MNLLSQWLQQLDVERLVNLLLTAVASLFCITIHELSHGYVAYRLGDPTAKDYGRLTLNPLKHLDIMGLVSMALLGFGWAKPVPVNFARLKNTRRDGALVALAGPVSNLVLAAVIMTLYSLTFWLCAYFEAGPWATYLLYFLRYGAVLNVGMAVFNLLPIPPLDGSKIALSFLPEKWYWRVLKWERYGFILLALLIFLGVLDGPLLFLRQLVYDGLFSFCRWPLDLLNRLVF